MQEIEEVYAASGHRERRKLWQFLGIFREPLEGEFKHQAHDGEDTWG
jgi:hypothetical protein